MSARRFGLRKGRSRVTGESADRAGKLRTENNAEAGSLGQPTA